MQSLNKDELNSIFYLNLSVLGWLILTKHEKRLLLKVFVSPAVAVKRTS